MYLVAKAAVESGKYGGAVPTKYKTGKEVKFALKPIFTKETPQKLWSEGKEFYTFIIQTADTI